ncbi:MAG: hypothetical protein KDA58_16930, partial [Planctomycetaceae bacterium]|nr:hypothetical protein [Planctomycetaceae bacterium]
DASARQFLISCLGCSAIIDARLPVCSGCGRCPQCGTIRGRHTAACPECDTPYCTCCGVCRGCGAARFSEIDTACDCGHPTDAVRLQELIDRCPVERAADRIATQTRWAIVAIVLTGVLGLAAVLALR